MPFTDLEAFLRPGFDLPIRGKTYYVPPPPAKEGLWLQSLVDAGEAMVLAGGITAAQKQVLGDDEERSMYQIALGPAWDEMVADGVDWPILKHAGLVATVYWTRGPEAAEKAWDRYGPGKAPTPEASLTDGSPAAPSIPAPA
jgi:hypothetical protein